MGRHNDSIKIVTGGKGRGDINSGELVNGKCHETLMDSSA